MAKCGPRGRMRPPASFARPLSQLPQGLTLYDHGTLASCALTLSTVEAEMEIRG